MGWGILQQQQQQKKKNVSLLKDFYSTKNLILEWKQNLQSKKEVLYVIKQFSRYTHDSVISIYM